MCINWFCIIVCARANSWQRFVINYLLIMLYWSACTCHSAQLQYINGVFYFCIFFSFGRLVFHSYTTFDSIMHLKVWHCTAKIVFALHLCWTLLANWKASFTKQTAFSKVSEGLISTQILFQNKQCVASFRFLPWVELVFPIFCTA